MSSISQDEREIHEHVARWAAANGLRIPTPARPAEMGYANKAISTQQVHRTPAFVRPAQPPAPVSKAAQFVADVVGAFKSDVSGVITPAVKLNVAITLAKIGVLDKKSADKLAGTTFKTGGIWPWRSHWLASAGADKVIKFQVESFAKLADARQQFVIAHECAHIVFEHPSEGKVDDERVLEQEAQADVLAELWGFKPE